MSEMTISDFGYSNAEHSHAHAYLYPALRAALNSHSPGKRVFELGCGNGSTAAHLSDLGYHVVGVDPSPSGIVVAQSSGGGAQLEVGSSDEDLAARFGAFDIVVSLEVAEHVYSPQRYASVIADLLVPGGVAIISTPYHSYLKNLALAASGKMENHFTALWEGGHIKFWSRDTLRTLFEGAGFEEIAFDRVGRFPVLAKSMLSTFRKTGEVFGV